MGQDSPELVELLGALVSPWRRTKTSSAGWSWRKALGRPGAPG